MPIYKTNNSETPTTASPRKGQGRMKRDEQQRIMRDLVRDSERLVDDELSPARAKASEYYLGEPFGNEEEGRSQVVLTEVRDVVHGMMPSLLRIFFGPERVVEFVPKSVAGVDAALQATDYVQYVFVEDNKGFLRTYDVLKDGLVRKLGIFKWWWDEESKRSYEEHDIDEAELMALASRDDVELTLVEEIESEVVSPAEQGPPALPAAPAAPQAAPAAPGAPLPPPDAPPQAPVAPTVEKRYNVEYTVKVEGKPCIVAIPPEEFLYNRGARDGDEALMLAHRTTKTRGELVSMGISEEEIDEHGAKDETLEFNVEAVQRRVSSGAQSGDDPEAGEANDEILYIEAYPYLDINGDGEAELVCVRMIGPGHHIVGKPEPADERPFALFCPIPEPHTMTGQSEADLVMDLQLVKSSVTRSMLDSLALSIYPRVAFVENMVSVEDLLNTEIGAPIRMKREGAAMPFSHPFTGEAAMPILKYFDEVGESRVGRSKGAMGLDADALQSSTQQAVGAAVGATQEQTELIARLFAEQALKPLFRGIYRMLVKYRPKERLIRLRGTYSAINTQAWEADLDVTVNVALGTTNVEKRINALLGIAAKQEQVIQLYGPDNPLCTVAQLRETYASITELSGYRDASRFFKQVPADWAPPAPEAPQPTPEQTLAQAQIQIEQMKTQKDLQIKQAELTLKQEHQRFMQDLEIRKMANDFVLRRYQIDSQFKTNHTQQQLEADARSEEAELNGFMSAHQQLHAQTIEQKQHALDAQAQAHEQELAAQSQAHDQEMARQQAAASTQAGAPSEGA